MKSNKLWVVVALGVAAGSVGCTMETEEPGEFEDVDEAEQALKVGPGVLVCAGGGTKTKVHPTTHAGNLLVKVDLKGNIVMQAPIACSTMGIAEILTDGHYEVVADKHLSKYAQGVVSCGACLTFQGSQGKFPPGNGGTQLYKSRVAYPTTVMTIGTVGYYPTSGYYFGNSSYLASINPSSFCEYDSPTWGRLTNFWGYELIDTGWESAFGTNAYQMWDPYWYMTRTASVSPSGHLTFVPRNDACH
jgi:hypothetical protein